MGRRLNKLIEIEHNLLANKLIEKEHNLLGAFVFSALWFLVLWGIFWRSRFHIFGALVSALGPRSFWHSKSESLCLEFLYLQVWVYLDSRFRLKHHLSTMEV